MAKTKRKTNAFALQQRITGAKRVADVHDREGFRDLRPWQKDVVDLLGTQSRRRILAPTGSGKSVAMQWLACGDIAAGYTVVVAVPRKDIRGSFAADSKMWDSRSGERRTWQPAVLTKVSQLRAALEEGSDAPVLCTHAALNAAFATKIKVIGKVSLFVDEAHHLSAGDDGDEVDVSGGAESNALHSVVESVSALSDSRVLLATATWMRVDTDVLAGDALQSYTTYTRPLVEHLKDAGIKTIEFRYLMTDSMTALKQSLLAQQKLIVFVQPGLLPEEKLRQNARFVRAARADNRQVLDLVDDRDKGALELRQLKFQQDQGLRERTGAVTALFRGNEGFDWPQCSQVLFTHPRNSLPQTVQMIGRAMRACPGKSKVQIDICVPDAVSTEQLRDHFRAMLGTACLGVLFQAQRIPARKREEGGEPSSGGTSAVSAVDELLGSTEFSATVLPTVVQSMKEGLSAKEIAKRVQPHAGAFPQMSELGVIEALVERFTKTTTGQTKVKREMRGSTVVFKGFENLDQLDCPIEIMRAVVRGVDLAIGKADSDLLSQIRMRNEEFVSLAECREICREAGIVSSVEYTTAFQDGKLPGCPSVPNRAYGLSGWTEFFGKPALLPRASSCSLADWRAGCAAAGVRTSAQYAEARKNGQLSGVYPSDPRRRYGLSWAELFNKKTDRVSLSVCIKMCKSLQISSVDEYNAARRAGRLPGCPSKPDSYGVDWWTLFSKRRKGSPQHLERALKYRKSSKSKHSKHLHDQPTASP